MITGAVSVSPPNSALLTVRSVLLVGGVAGIQVSALLHRISHAEPELPAALAVPTVVIDVAPEPNRQPHHDIEAQQSPRIPRQPARAARDHSHAL